MSAKNNNMNQPKMKKLTLLIIFSFVIQALSLGITSAYAEVEPFDMDEVMELEDYLRTDGLIEEFK